MSDLNTKLSEILNAAVETRSVAGVAVAAGAGARPQAVWSPDSSRDEPAFLAYSITKTFTAALVLLLSEEGRLSLDDRLARWFPKIAGADRISLRLLLNHTAGIPDYGGLRSYHDDLRASPSKPWSFERFAAETFDKGLRFEPGSAWAYSNPGYMLLKRMSFLLFLTCSTKGLHRALACGAAGPESRSGRTPRPRALGCGGRGRSAIRGAGTVWEEDANPHRPIILPVTHRFHCNLHR